MDRIGDLLVISWPHQNKVTTVATASQPSDLPLGDLISPAPRHSIPIAQSVAGPCVTGTIAQVRLDQVKCDLIHRELMCPKSRDANFERSGTNFGFCNTRRALASGGESSSKDQRNEAQVRVDLLKVVHI